VFTEHFFKAIEQPGIELNVAIKKIAAAVRDDTGGQQVPWAEGIIIGNFYFIAPISPVATPSAFMPSSAPGAAPEVLFWQRMSQCGTPACLQAYIDTYPKGGYVRGAKALLANLTPILPSLIPFTVKTTPEGARVRILNIGPKYRDGIELKPGRYRVEATQQGYRKHLGWHELTAANPVYVAEMEAIPPAPPKPLYSEPQATRPQNLRPSGDAARARQVWREPRTGMEFVEVPKGCFSMGSDSGKGDEKPVHKVCLDGFWLGKYEVTQGQWKKVMGSSNPSKFQKGDNHPVEQVSWKDAQEYIRRLNGQGGAQFRLPTEAEWEYACRSGGKDEKYSGGDAVNTVAWYGEGWERGHHPVGGKAANGLGLQDMSGNVLEWVEDVYAGDAYQRHASENPVNTVGGSSRVGRGGSWRSYASVVRCAFRISYDPGFRSYYLGFRLLRQ
jgi:formylglycine-generating enzyme required for sulfatase activity